MYNSILEDTQQSKEVHYFRGPTSEEKMEQKLKCWVNSTKVSLVAALAQSTKLSVTIFTATNENKQNVPVV